MGGSALRAFMARGYRTRARRAAMLAALLSRCRLELPACLTVKRERVAAVVARDDENVRVGADEEAAERDHADESRLEVEGTVAMALIRNGSPQNTPRTCHGAIQIADTELRANREDSVEKL